MITVREATAIIFDHLFKPATAVVRLEEASGKVLAEHVYADRDFPPFHRVAMDGIAIRHQSWVEGRRLFPVEGVQAAGEAQQILSDPSHCLEVMTGAILPLGCDAVIRYEDIEIQDNQASVKADKIAAWQSIHRQALDAREGEALLPPGFLISPSEVALMASVGKSKVRIFSSPKIAVISTGDELVDVDAVPSPFQIRRSNTYALESALRKEGCDVSRFHLDDEKSSMERSLAGIVSQCDALVLSGGVSKGKFDFVPAVLEKVGIQKLFHQVSQRPGKPFWFGSSPSGKVAFALPGNPVSTFMCFYRYVRPWLLRSMGVVPPENLAVLGTDFSFPHALTCFLQVEIKNDAGRLIAWPHPGGGSGDFANLKKVSAFLELPLEKNDFKAGEVFPVIFFRD